eukprot:4694044-Pleurochrysis_carterae.AAC.3
MFRLQTAAKITGWGVCGREKRGKAEGLCKRSRLTCKGWRAVCETHAELANYRTIYHPAVIERGTIFAGLRRFLFRHSHVECGISREGIFLMLGSQNSLFGKQGNLRCRVRFSPPSQSGSLGRCRIAGALFAVLRDKCLDTAACVGMPLRFAVSD